MTANSNKAYFTTYKIRQTNKKRVLEALMIEPNQSRFEIGRRTGLGGFEAQRRLSDLLNEGKIKITGSRKHGKNEVSLYSVVDSFELFCFKKLGLREWVKINHPEILKKYENL